MIHYEDCYETCAKTYATVRIYDLPSDRVSQVLGVSASETQVGGMVRLARRARPSAWFLTSANAVDSRDVRRHIDWCLDQLEPKREQLRQLRQEGARIDLSCYWLSAFGHGGPTLSPRQSSKLAALDLECWFDVHFLSDDSGEDAE